MAFSLDLAAGALGCGAGVGGVLPASAWGAACTHAQATAQAHERRAAPRLVGFAQARAAAV